MVVRETLATALTGPGLPQFLARANVEARLALTCDLGPWGFRPQLKCTQSAAAGDVDVYRPAS